MRSCVQEAERKLPALLTADQNRGLLTICQNMAERVATRLSDYRRNLRIAPESLSTTLVGAVIEAEPASSAGRGCVVFAVGDSTAFLLRGGTFTRSWPTRMMASSRAQRQVPCRQAPGPLPHAGSRSGQGTC